MEDTSKSWILCSLTNILKDDKQIEDKTSAKIVKIIELCKDSQSLLVTDKYTSIIAVVSESVSQLLNMSTDKDFIKDKYIEIKEFSFVNFISADKFTNHTLFRYPLLFISKCISLDSVIQYNMNSNDYQSIYDNKMIMSLASQFPLGPLTKENQEYHQSTFFRDATNSLDNQMNTLLKNNTIKDIMSDIHASVLTQFNQSIHNNVAGDDVMDKRNTFENHQDLNSGSKDDDTDILLSVDSNDEKEQETSTVHQNNETQSNSPKTDESMLHYDMQQDTTSDRISNPLLDDKIEIAERQYKENLKRNSQLSDSLMNKSYKDSYSSIIPLASLHLSDTSMHMNSNSISHSDNVTNTSNPLVSSNTIHLNSNSHSISSKTLNTNEKNDKIIDVDMIDSDIPASSSIQHEAFNHSCQQTSYTNTIPESQSKNMDKLSIQSNKEYKSKNNSIGSESEENKDMQDIDIDFKESKIRSRPSLFPTLSLDVIPEVNEDCPNTTSKEENILASRESTINIKSLFNINDTEKESIDNIIRKDSLVNNDENHTDPTIVETHNNDIHVKTISKNDEMNKCESNSNSLLHIEDVDMTNSLSLNNHHNHKHNLNENNHNNNNEYNHQIQSDLNNSYISNNDSSTSNIKNNTLIFSDEDSSELHYSDDDIQQYNGLNIVIEKEKKKEQRLSQKRFYADDYDANGNILTQKKTCSYSNDNMQLDDNCSKETSEKISKVRSDSIKSKEFPQESTNLENEMNDSEYLNQHSKKLNFNKLHIPIKTELPSVGSTISSTISSTINNDEPYFVESSFVPLSLSPIKGGNTYIKKTVNDLSTISMLSVDENKKYDDISMNSSLKETIHNEYDNKEGDEINEQDFVQNPSTKRMRYSEESFSGKNQKLTQTVPRKQLSETSLKKYEDDADYIWGYKWKDKKKKNASHYLYMDLMKEWNKKQSQQK